VQKVKRKEIKMLKKLLVALIIICVFIWAQENVNPIKVSLLNTNLGLKENVPSVYAQGSIDDQIVMIKTKIEQIDREISRTEDELRRVPGPNWLAGCLWIGCVLGLPGAIVWYFTDIKPKGDQRADLKDKIERLQNEKANFENQLMLLQMQKK